ncbi:DDE transposase [Anaerobacillus arseniciselenatis]|uniref:DDE transposase n=1 Tax=Anaerobacillus arseniciselenatis TaxID=85682 RepID=A0A1S2LA98_9BACI|nr:Tn3 family transposase [Anaerobacillus arseniciselenatis]OIJ09409.1 DDE transposase [Anaerobacillus arseniciselenatis]
MRGKELLTLDQRNMFMSFPDDMTEHDMEMYYTFTSEDLAFINKHRRDHNRLGIALQLAVLRYPGWNLFQIKDIPSQILDYIAKQIDVSPQEYTQYAKRVATRNEHLEELRQHYGYQNLSFGTYRIIAQYTLQRALENGNTDYLIRLTIEELRRQKVILPAMTTIERIVWEARQRAEERIFKSISSTLNETQKPKLDHLLDVSSTYSKTPLAWLREVPGQSSPDAFLKVIQRLQVIRALQLNVDIKKIHPNRILQLARLGSKYEPRSFRRFKENKKFALLILHLLQLSQNLTDHAFEIHDRQITLLLSKGRKAQEEIQKLNGKSVNEKVIHFADLGTALIQAREQGKDPFEALEAIMPWEDLVNSIEEAKQLSRPMDYDYLDLLKFRFNYLRKYTPTLLESLEFTSTKSGEPLLRAIDTIKEMNRHNKRKVPEGAPLDFVSNRWQKHVYDDDGNVNRQYYEMAVLTELRNLVRSGSVSIKGSRQHQDFDNYLVAKETWEQNKQINELSAPPSVDEYLVEKMDALHNRLEWIKANITELDGVNFEDGRLYVHRLEKNVPEIAREYSLSLYQLIPRVKLPDLLMEVASWTGFDKQLLHASTLHPPKEEEKPAIMAAIMAMGTNIGLTKMAEATQGISYRQMSTASQWRLYEDAMNKAQAVLVNFQHKLSLSSYWGDGTTSSSDGMRVQVGVSSLHADANPHYGTGKGATIYRFVSDQFSSFYTKVINTNARDAVHVIDGLLHHETDLHIEEHYTDTAGYTDQVFGLTNLLGFRFAPRLRDLADSKLYSFEKPDQYPEMEKLLRGRINTKIIQGNYDDVLRLAHSIRKGTVSASLIMGKLGSYSRQNSLAATLREMGRIDKTLFILDYISSETLRRRIQRGLNKGEAMNALARAIFFGKHGELRERALQDQLQRASALNLIINAISIWNTVYLSQAIEHLKTTGKYKEELLPHISPLGWEHINFLGEYSFKPEISNSVHSLRPLRI